MPERYLHVSVDIQVVPKFKWVWNEEAQHYLYEQDGFRYVADSRRHAPHQGNPEKSAKRKARKAAKGHQWRGAYGG